LLIEAIDRVGDVSTKSKKRMKANKILGYVEAHHIIPRSVNQDYSSIENNIVYLTTREHFICHLLLERIFRKTVYNHKMLFALNYLSNRFKNNSPAYS